MTNTQSIQKQHTAAAQGIGFDYQFYLFMYLSLELRYGQKIGFEVKDDIHIDLPDGSTILFQAKHTVLTGSYDKSQNLTELDVDLWKTISNWVDFIKSSDDHEKFLNSHNFVLITNKSDGNNNFITSLLQFKNDENLEVLVNFLKELLGKTENSTIKKNIKNILSLGKRKMKRFFKKLTIDTEVDNITERVKQQIWGKCNQAELVDPIFEKLSSNMHEAKYLGIKGRKQFEITFDDFSKRFGRCFRPAFQDKPLPKRELRIHLTEDLESQTFIKQLLDIGEVKSGSKYIEEYTAKMLKTLNHFSYWVDENFVLPTEMDDFRKNSIEIWANEFKAKYRRIERKLETGASLGDLESEIRDLG
ncbi:hypothetical protein BXY85_1628 [Roseivirga pacifica]|uniref:CD-NTase associated protein 4-like DNA endonuclease domain-containing protein n=1 Tax=Roseivirga pacifica TaxID=1267423 RepID=A0A1I0MRD9_9BACT|nr:hypothetical protein [Roseivirga pacifica]RKQ50612.1 hypothetical protein BXY85_1628 [Roseivirga pacifica]SEV90790.1 hypothetical protein SAMN05216290_0612 [Roseivirga pacifica]